MGRPDAHAVEGSSNHESGLPRPSDSNPAAGRASTGFICDSRRGEKDPPNRSSSASPPVTAALLSVPAILKVFFSGKDSNPKLIGIAIATYADVYQVLVLLFNSLNMLSRLVCL
ncbi:hypothetical protein EJB05_43557, partial [Eragrostis curvula]